jgi:hypothetical protein
VLTTVGVDIRKHLETYRLQHMINNVIRNNTPSQQTQQQLGKHYSSRSRCWKCGFGSRWRHGCSSHVYLSCFVGSSPDDGLITRSEEPYRVCMCMCMCVCLIAWNTGTSEMRRPRLELVCCTTKKNRWRFKTTWHTLRANLRIKLQNNTEMPHLCDCADL